MVDNIEILKKNFYFHFTGVIKKLDQEIFKFFQYQLLFDLFFPIIIILYFQDFEVYFHNYCYINFYNKILNDYNTNFVGKAFKHYHLLLIIIFHIFLIINLTIKINF